MGTLPLDSARTFAASLSTHTTSFPLSAKHTPATRPTYPVPTTAIFMSLRHGCSQPDAIIPAEDAGPRGLPPGAPCPHGGRRIYARARASLHRLAPRRRRGGVHELMVRPAGARHWRGAPRPRHRPPRTRGGAEPSLAPRRMAAGGMA